eukprot:5941483-Pyramimonas_sp.AAC.1
MDRELRLGVDWVAVRDKHVNSARRDAHTHAPRASTAAAANQLPGLPRAERPRVQQHRAPGLEPLELPPPASGGAGKS